MGVVPIWPANLFPLPARIGKGAIQVWPQQMVWYSFPIGCGFLGTKIHPGQENFDVQMLMDSSKQDTQAGLKTLVILSLIERDNQLSHFMDLVLKQWKGDIRVLKGGQPG